MGDKVDAKREMIAAGVPVVPGTEEPTSIGDAGSAAEETGYPVLLKAVAGGGGKGMRFVEHPEDLERAYQMAAAEAEAALGDPGSTSRRPSCPHVTSRSGPGRRTGRRAHAGRARLLDPAPAPEADRGVAIPRRDAGDPRGDGGSGGTGLPRDRLPQRGNFRVPPRPGRLVLLHRAERTTPGRAPGDGDDHWSRPRP